MGRFRSQEAEHPASFSEPAAWRRPSVGGSSNERRCHSRRLMDMNSLAARRLLWSAVGAEIRRAGGGAHALALRGPLAPGLMALAYPSLVRQAHLSSEGSPQSGGVRAERDVDELMESNPYYAKYYDKIAALRASDPRKFEAAVKNKIGSSPAAATKTAASGPPAFPQLRAAGRPAAAAAADTAPPGDGPSRRPLGAIMRLDLIADMTADEIASLWNAYHSDKGGVYCILPASAYSAMRDRARESATFVYPLPRGGRGFEFFVGQWLGDACHFAPLVAYHAHGESAPVCVSLAYYTELIDSKGVVLMSGEVDAAVLQLHLAQLLVHQLHAFYGSEENYRLVQCMHSRPREFRHEDVVEACKKWSLL